jgi:hypothetical protein
MEGLVGTFGQAHVDDEQLGLAAGRREIERGALALFGGTAFDPLPSLDVVAGRLLALRTGSTADVGR